MLTRACSALRVPRRRAEARRNTRTSPVGVPGDAGGRYARAEDWDTRFEGKHGLNFKLLCRDMRAAGLVPTRAALGMLYDRLQDREFTDDPLLALTIADWHGVRFGWGAPHQLQHRLLMSALRHHHSVCLLVLGRMESAAAPEYTLAIASASSYAEAHAVLQRYEATGAAATSDMCQALIASCEKDVPVAVGTAEALYRAFTAHSAPTASMCAALMSVYVTAGRPVRAVQVYQHLRASSVKPNSDVYVQIITACTAVAARGGGDNASVWRETDALADAAYQEALQRKLAPPALHHAMLRQYKATENEGGAAVVRKRLKQLGWEWWRNGARFTVLEQDTSCISGVQK